MGGLDKAVSFLELECFFHRQALQLTRNEGLKELQANISDVVKFSDSECHLQKTL